MVAVVDETTSMVYLFGEPDAENKIDEWNQTGAETFASVEPVDESNFIADFSFLDLVMLVAA